MILIKSKYATFENTSVSLMRNIRIQIGAGRLLSQANRD